MQCFDVSQPGRAQQLPHRRTLPVTVLDSEPRAGKQMRWRLGNDVRKVGKSGIACNQSGAGLETGVTLLRFGLVLTDIRRIGNDQMEALAPYRLVPAAATQLYVGQT